MRVDPDVDAFLAFGEELVPTRLQEEPLMQVAAETRGSVGFVQTAPLLAELVEIEHGEARKRLPAGIPVPGRHRRHRSGVLTGASR